MRGLAILCLGLVLGAGALWAFLLTAPGTSLRVQTGPAIADLRDRLAQAPLFAHQPSPAPTQAPIRTVMEGGRVVVRLSDEEFARIGIRTAQLKRVPHRIELQAYGSVLDLARVTELTNAYTSARAALQTAQARAEVSGSAARRAKSLGQYATPVQVETAEGTSLTDQAALMAADSQLRTLAATAQQEWGPVIGRAIVERSALVTRLIERTDLLVQVTLPPGETVKAQPATASAEVPPQSERVAMSYVSPATRTDQRVQGVSYFYTVPGDSGLLPGMSALAFLTLDRKAVGIGVPESAVVHWQGGAWIYRGVGRDGFVRHAVRMDAPISADTYVVDDLGPEARIVVSGPQTVLSEELRGQTQTAGEADDD